jgi:hypothetical protein
MRSLKSNLRAIIHFVEFHWIPEGLAAAMGIWALFQLWGYAHTRESVLDEGAYLYKGLLYAIGRYRMYQPYGPWSYHMPLAYLIPGFIQRLFGPGLASGRYFSIVVTGFMLLGLWWLARRLSGRWWAAIVLGAFILNPSILKTFSLGVSQALVACMLVWVLLLVVGEGRQLWQILLGSALAGVIFITRLDMLPVLPLVIWYVYWQSGRKQAALAIVASLVPILLVHIWYWPGILQVWGWWLPRGLTPFLDGWRIPAGTVRYWNPTITFGNQVASFFMAFRFHFTTLVGAIAVFLLWPRRKHWQNEGEYRTALFLSVLLVVLYLFHLWAALGKNYCVQCLTAYTAFYSMIGLLLVALTFPVLRKHLPWWHQAIILLVVLSLCAGIGYSALEDIGAPLLDLRLPRVLADPLSFNFSVERLRKTLSLRYELPNMQQRIWASTAAGFMVGIGIVVIGLVWYWTYSRLRRAGVLSDRPTISIGYTILMVFVTVGAVLSPTIPLGGGPYAYDCPGDAIKSYRIAGEALARVIPPGSKVYWAGDLSAVPLLYIPGAITFTPQIEGSYSRFVGGDADKLLRFGLWNEEIAQEWARESDFILIKERYYEGWLKELVESEAFDELEPTPSTVECRPDARIHIFQRISSNP